MKEADGEALLGWLNATLTLTGASEFDANDVLETLAREVQARLDTAGGEVAHLKMTFSPSGGLNDIASAGGRAVIFAEERVLTRMSAPTGKQAAYPTGAWPTSS